MSFFINALFASMFVGGLIPVIIGFASYHSLTPVKRLILALMVCSLGLNIIQITLALHSIPNLFIGHIYTLIEFILIAYIYKLKLDKLIPLSVFMAIVVGFVVFSLFNTFVIQGLHANNSYQRTLESVLVVVFVSLYFYKTAKELKVQRIEREPLFWFSAGALLYFSGALFIFIFSNYLLLYSRSLGITFWTAHTFFLLLLYLFSTIALWINPKK